jgi:ABC-2 type transport system ATP-binding protein
MPRDTNADLNAFAPAVQQRLEQVAGVSRVLHKDSKDGRVHFTIESLKDRHIRPELARAVVESGWQLNELHGMGLSLEEIFLELTASKDTPALEPATAATTPASEEAAQ